MLCISAGKCMILYSIIAPTLLKPEVWHELIRIVKINSFKWYNVFHKDVDIEAVACVHNLQYSSVQCICRHAVSVRLSVTFVSCAKTNKDIFEIFSPSGRQAILVFPYQTGWRYSAGNPHNGGVECKGVWWNWRFSTNISLYLRNGYSSMGTCSETICKHRILFPSIQHLAWLPQGRPQGKPKCDKK